MPSRTVKRYGLLGAALLLPWAGIALLGDLAHGHLPRFLLLYFTAAALYLAALVLVARGRERPRALRGIVIAAVLARVVLLAAPPSLSSDAERYRWEGRVQLAGHNPYVTPPDSPALSELRDGGWLRVNHREVPAIYGPALQLLFRLLARLPGELLPFKLAFLACDLALFALVLGGLRRRGLSPLWLLLYAWHPLAVLETAGQAHLEVVPVFLLALAVELDARGRARSAALALGASIAAKYLAVLVLPAFLWRAPSWRERAQRLALVATPGLLCLVPFLAGADQLTQGLSAYGGRWRFNDGGFWAIDALLRESGLSAWFCRAVLPRLIDVPPGTDPGQHQTWLLILPKAVVAGLVLAILGWVSRPGARSELRGVALVAGGLFLALSPTVHPWYALWVLAFLPGAEVREGRAAWLWLSLALPLSYVVLLGYSGLPGSWREEPAVRLAIWLPWAALLLGSWACAGITRRGRSPRDRPAGSAT